MPVGASSARKDAGLREHQTSVSARAQINLARLNQA
jgi:hypothetical protein